MKFTKKYETYMRGIRVEEELPGVGLKRLKKMLKKCRSELSSHNETASSSAAAAGGGQCAGHCSVDDDDGRRALLRLLALLKLLHPLLLRLLALEKAEGLLQLGVIGDDLVEAGALGAPLHPCEERWDGLHVDAAERFASTEVWIRWWQWSIWALELRRRRRIWRGSAAEWIRFLLGSGELSGICTV